ncbi:hypothetical protein [Streptomyces gibsoniae]|uniref:Ferredoxin n=1 Tax=Streptomyces gibsoniae TaxID=3075529 RepID=A0ABU2U241_9ACTN|nr:hypothetical protein [Streptomyces sp. DSM 41699]MDT0467116.1 hypothetical protein [Streptomyces sp. DSM 41699]
MKLVCAKHPNTEVTLNRTAEGRWDICGLPCPCIAERAAEHIRQATEDPP